MLVVLDAESVRLHVMVAVQEVPVFTAQGAASGQRQRQRQVSYLHNLILYVQRRTKDAMELRFLARALASFQASLHTRFIFFRSLVVVLCQVVFALPLPLPL